MSTVKKIKPSKPPLSKSKLKEESAVSMSPSKREDRHSNSDATVRTSQTSSQDISEEERDLMILQIRDEIVDNAVDICYSTYLNDQVIAFTVHCTYLALNDVINCYFLSSDDGDPNAIDRDRPEDIEPPTLVADAWSGHWVPNFETPVEPAKSINEQTADEMQKSLRGHSRIPSCKLELEHKDDNTTIVFTDNTKQTNTDGLLKTPQDEGHKLSVASASIGYRKQSTVSKTVRASVVEEIKTVSNPIMSKRIQRRVAQEASAEQYVPEAIKAAKLPEDKIEVKYNVCQTDPRTGPPSQKSVKSKGQGPPPRKKKVPIIRL